MGNRKRLWFGLAVALGGLVAAPRIALAYKSWRIEQRQAAIERAKAALAHGADGVDLTGLLDTEENDADEHDDATVRNLAMAAERGLRPPAAIVAMLETVRAEKAKWADPTAAIQAGATLPGTRAWTNLGPLAARSEFNGTFYKAMDAGRPTAFALDPSNASGLFIAFSGGGVWYAPDFNTTLPSWVPITDNLGALAIGAMAVSPTVADNGDLTLWLGLGDAFDEKVGAVVKGTFNPTSGVSTWGTPAPLVAASHPADGFAVAAQDVRDLRLDPANANHILVATNEGLFQSTDGATFTLVDLPNSAIASTTVRESTWSIAYLGNNGGQTSWLVSGVYGCPTVNGQTTGTSPPLAGAGTLACGADTAHWNLGDIWKSTDSGATWTSLHSSFPAGVLAATPGNDPGRIMLGAGPAGLGTTVIYAQAGSSFEGGSAPGGCTATPPVPAGGTLCSYVTATAWYMKSTDGGATWTKIASGLSWGRGGVGSPTTAGVTALQNPTTGAGDSTTSSGSGCTTVNVGHVQSWYNLTVAVDPQNTNHALFGGDLCGMITRDGGATFSAASHWLPQGGAGFTANGFLPYVHADWHASLAYAQSNGQTAWLAGSDGGIFVTTNIFDVATPELGQWRQPTAGIATHLFYGIGTGDPTLGNPNVVFGGLQDNGSRWRLVSDESFIDEFNSGNWDQILGGDGLGAAATSDTLGQNQVYWISVNGSRRFCVPRVWDCSQATRIQNGVESVNWRNPTSPAADPFLIRYDPLGDDTSAVASASNTQANLWFVNPVSLGVSVRTVVPAGSLVIDGAGRTIRGMGLRVSPYRYTIDGVAKSRIYGGVTTSSTTGFGSFLVYDKPGVGSTVVAAGHGVNVANATTLGTKTIWIGNGSDFAAPQNPASLGGTDSKRTWLVSSNSVISNAVNCATPTAANCDPAVFIPASVGHIFKTIDGGTTWTPFHGNGTGFDLPNVPVWVMRYDPSDTTDQTLWVGTDIGVYRTTDGGNTWAPYGQGLPAVRVTDIRISNNGSVVRVSTYGRGVWEVTPGSEPATANGTGDFDKNHVIDFFDMAALAARTGSTPAAPENLQYDSSLDLDKSAKIDEADLALLVAKFGSNQ